MLSSWPGRAALLAIVASAGGVGYLLFLIGDGILTALGLGVIPVGLWLVLLVWGLTARRSWFRRPNLWIASVALVALSLGVLAFFEANQGALTEFTADGEVSLGGDVGESIIGSSQWQGVLRLLGIFILGVAATAPVLAADISVRVGKQAPGAFARVPTAASWVVEKYRLDQRFRNFNKKATVSAPSLDAVVPPGVTPLHALVTEAPNAIEWSRPPGDLLADVQEVRITDEEIAHNSESIRRTLAEYGVEVEIGQTWPGPTVTIYGLIPGWVRRYKQVREKDEEGRPKLDDSGNPVVTQREESKTRVRVDSILAREKDLALVLKTPSIRIETPVMGESLLGIEVPNPNPSPVALRNVMESEEFAQLRPKARLPVALGKGSGGGTVVIDLAKMPHLLIAGATGSGKSVCINTIISCLIMEKTPAEMRLMLIDPKRVELTPYNGIPHLLTPVVVETDHVVGLLQGMVDEMMDRYRRMEEVGARNIEAYNEGRADKMPFMVIAIDELADLMMTAATEVERLLCRLAQLARATGIHLVVATQRPSVDVVTGLIKANFPSRISFGVTSQVDSRTILDTEGADKLLGRGDMLYLPMEASRPTRVQGVFISDREVRDLVNYWKSPPQAVTTDVSPLAQETAELDQ